LIRIKPNPIEARYSAKCSLTAVFACLFAQLTRARNIADIENYSLSRVQKAGGIYDRRRPVRSLKAAYGWLMHIKARPFLKTYNFKNLFD
jgi:hypothetical protein